MRAIYIALLALCFTGCTPGVAQTPTRAQVGMCNKTEVVAQILAKQYSERPVANGDAKSRDEPVHVEIFASMDGKTWSMVITWPRTGISCLAVAGQRWTQTIDIVYEKGEGT